jgi:hypothetical protein
MKSSGADICVAIRNVDDLNVLKDSRIRCRNSRGNTPKGGKDDY